MVSGNGAGRQRPGGAVRGTPERPYRVLVVDDHPVVAQGTEQLLGSVADLEVIGAVTDVAAALERLDADGDVDVILLDLQLDGESGLALLSALGDPAGAVPVLVFSMHPPGPLAVAALEAGARGYLTKGAPVEIIAAALRRVAGGGSWTDPELEAVLAERTIAATALSPREVEVLLLLAAGQRTSEIAAQLHLSPQTISTHKRRIQRKLGARNVADLLRYAELLQPGGEVA